jgi:hypothetical protein
MATGACTPAGTRAAASTTCRLPALARTLFDSAEDEIRALAVDASGQVWAAALSASATTTGSSGATAGDDPAEDEGPRPTRAPVAGGKAVLYRSRLRARRRRGGRPRNRSCSRSRTRSRACSRRRAIAPGSTQSSAPTAPRWNWPRRRDRSLPGSVGRGGLCAHVESGRTLEAGSGKRQRGRAHLRARSMRRVSRVSEDCARRVRARAASARAAATATQPDTTWSRWQPIAGEGAIASPPGRYLQWKVRLGDRDDRVSEVAISRREPNLAPRVEELSVAPQAQGFREGEHECAQRGRHAGAAGGQRVEYSALLTTSRALQEMPLWARGLRTTVVARLRCEQRPAPLSRPRARRRVLERVGRLDRDRQGP